MAKYQVFETQRFQLDKEDLLTKEHQFIVEKLKNYVYPQLRQQPFYGKNIKKLRNFVPPTWRYRIGDWRFFYSIDDEKRLIFMLKADNRKDAY